MTPCVMNARRMKQLAVGALLAATALLAGCTDAEIANRNLSKAADQFEIDRRVVFYNGITADYMLTIEGRCSIKADTMDGQLEVTCKTGDGFKKHFLGLSDNVSYVVEQLAARDVSTAHYRVVFKPQTILPDVDLRAEEPLAPPTLNRPAPP